MKNQISFDKQASFYDTSIYSRIPRMCYPHVMDALKNIGFGMWNGYNIKYDIKRIGR